MVQSVPIRINDAILVVDIQNDFCPGGALGVADADTIIPVVNQLIPRFRTVVFSRDWHPENHCSFSSEPTMTDGSWPAHCIADTHGAAFHGDLHVPDGALIVNKADNRNREAYSGFQGTNLIEMLKERHIDQIYICGLATDYCVRFSALDALKAGFRVRVIQDAVKGINVPDGSERQALEAMVKAGAEIVQSSQLLG